MRRKIVFCDNSKYRSNVFTMLLWGRMLAFENKIGWEQVKIGGGLFVSITYYEE
jgi:hypothetical protein